MLKPPPVLLAMFAGALVLAQLVTIGLDLLTHDVK
jgi:hypothetical protein